MFTGGEDIVYFYERVESFLKEVPPYVQDREILTVAHGGVSVPHQCSFKGYACVENLNDLIITSYEVRHYAAKQIQKLVKG